MLHMVSHLPSQVPEGFPKAFPFRGMHFFASIEKAAVFLVTGTLAILALFHDDLLIDVDSLFDTARGIAWHSIE